MVLVKTQAGQEALKDRHGSLTSRQRSAFILFDGKRSTAEILAATAAMGITQADVQAMIDHGLLVSLSGQPAAVAPGAAGADATASVADAAGASDRSPMDRYKDAYPVATALTAELGLRGFRLNLAVEGAGSFADLSALAPKIREAVGDAKFAKLDKALFG
jgi:hypothetical protein